MRSERSPVYVDAMILRDCDADNNSGTGTNCLEQRLNVVQDANFNVTALLNTSGTVVERFDYDAYSTPTVLDGSWGAHGTSSYGWVYLHQGCRLDTITGLYHFRNRDYSPTLGRWVSMDPIRYSANDVNLYRSMSNNHLIQVDPQVLWGYGLYSSASAFVGNGFFGGGGGDLGGGWFSGNPAKGIFTWSRKLFFNRWFFRND